MRVTQQNSPPRGDRSLTRLERIMDDIARRYGWRSVTLLYVSVIVLAGLLLCALLVGLVMLIT